MLYSVDLKYKVFAPFLIFFSLRITVADIEEKVYSMKS